MTTIWEKDMKITFCDIYFKEVKLGNRPTNPIGRNYESTLLKT